MLRLSGWGAGRWRAGSLGRSGRASGETGGAPQLRGGGGRLAWEGGEAIERLPWRIELGHSTADWEVLRWGRRASGAAGAGQNKLRIAESSVRAVAVTTAGGWSAPTRGRGEEGAGHRRAR